MMFLCRQLHLTEVRNGDAKLDLFCKGCNKTIKKYHTYKFLRVYGRWYLAQQSKPTARKKMQIYARNYMREARKKPGYKQRQRAYDLKYWNRNKDRINTERRKSND